MTRNDRMRTEISASISHAIDYLYRRQLPTGEFSILVSRDPTMQGDLAVDSSPSVAAIVTYCTRFVEDLRVSQIRRKALSFFVREMELPGVWRFWTSRSPKRIDPDLDDTSWISFLLKRHHPYIALGSNVQVLLSNRDERGLFYTWIRKAGERNDVDSVVNANVLLYLGPRSETRIVCDYLNRLVLWDREANSFWYYPDNFALYYAMSRAFFNGVCELGKAAEAILDKVLVRQQDDGSFGSDINTAYAACTMLNFGLSDHLALDRAVRHMLSRQEPDGAWSLVAACTGPEPPEPASVWWGSKELTTAFSLEALARYRAVVLNPSNTDSPEARRSETQVLAFQALDRYQCSPTEDELSLLSMLRPEVLANPYPLYRRLRCEDPIHWDERLAVWVVSRYDDVAFALQDSRFHADRLPNRDTIGDEKIYEFASIFELLAQQMPFRNSSDHRRLRLALGRAFTPSAVENLRSQIVRLVEDLLARVQDRGSMDLVADFAHELPLCVIAAVLGLPGSDQRCLKNWTQDFARLFGTFPLTPPDFREIGASILQFRDHIRIAIRMRREHPTEDLLSNLLAAAEMDKTLSEDEVVANVILLLAAGHKTTANLIGNGILALLQNPSELQRLRDDTSLILSAVEELLRYESPVQFTTRLVSEELELGGNWMRPGHRVRLALGAANRDPTQFENPDVLDLSRTNNRHVAFGHGNHFCLGAQLARVQGQIAIGAVVRRLPGLRLPSTALAWQRNVTFRGLESLHVSFARSHLTSM
jgi:cytochrome P450